jgi:ABC-type polysaccharide/polyol phosphate transport system ATPase subunit
MIIVDSISKKFKLYRSPADRMKEILIRKKYHTDFQALNNVSFSVAAGETLGIIGENGAGKSTLLKILTGILLPDSGTISIDGKITGLLELGTGFNAEMTGIENIYMNGTLLNMTREEIERKKNAIIDFSELGEFIYEQLKTYSSGMVMRLAFAIAIHADPRCFVVDEALAVGDAYFQQKCMRKIIEFKDTGGSIIFVSHDMNAVKILCDAAILLQKGGIVKSGKPAEVTDLFLGIILKKMHQGESEVIINKPSEAEKSIPFAPKQVASSGDVEVVSFRILDGQDGEVSHITSEANVKIEYEIRSLKRMEDPHYGIAIKSNLGVSIFETNTYCMKIKTAPLGKGEIVKVRFAFKCNLSPGDYSICIGVANKGYDRGSFEEYSLVLHDAGILKVVVNREQIIYGGVYNIMPIVFINDVPSKSQLPRHGKTI